MKPGDTLWDLAREFDHGGGHQGRNNLRSDRIVVGQVLKIDRSFAGGEVSDLVYVVSRGDNLYNIAKQYNTTVDALISVNNIKNPNVLPVGKTLIIPGIASGGTRKLQMIWPVTGRISSDFGRRIHPIRKVEDFHSGLDIAVPTGTRVRAAAEGVVTFSGWMGGLGMVVIDHGDGVETSMPTTLSCRFRWAPK